MDQLTSLQHLEYLDAGFEVSNILAHAGYRMEAPAFVITWGQLAEIVAHTLADYGLSPYRLDEGQILNLVQSAQQALSNGETYSWQEELRRQIVTMPDLALLLEPSDPSDDEGPLTEQYENSTRLGDDEAYWVDGGESADLFDDL